MVEVWMVALAVMLTLAAPCLGMLLATIRTDAAFRRDFKGE